MVAISDADVVDDGYHVAIPYNDLLGQLAAFRR